MKIISISFLKEGAAVGRVTAGFETSTGEGAAVWSGNLDPYLHPGCRWLTHCRVFSADEFTSVLLRIAEKNGLTTTVEESGDWKADGP